MSLGHSLFTALKGKLIISAFLWLVISYLDDYTQEALWNYEQNEVQHSFNTLESAAFTWDAVGSLREIRGESINEPEFLEFENVHGVRAFLSWANLVDLLVERLRHKGYSNVDRAFDDIVMAMMFLAFRDIFASAASEIGTLANLLQLAFEALSSDPEEEEADGQGEGSGEPQPEADGQGEGSGEPQPEADGQGEGSGEPQPEAEAQGEEGSGEPQPEEEAVDVPMEAERVRGVRRYRLRNTPQRELSRQRRVRSRYALRDTPARRDR